MLGGIKKNRNALFYHFGKIPISSLKEKKSVEGETAMDREIAVAVAAAPTVQVEVPGRETGSGKDLARATTSGEDGVE